MVWRMGLRDWRGSVGESVYGGRLKMTGCCDEVKPRLML